VSFLSIKILLILKFPKLCPGPIEGAFIASPNPLADVTGYNSFEVLYYLGAVFA